MLTHKPREAIAKYLREAFGGHPEVTRYCDDNNRSQVDIMACKDRPTEGVISYGTVGLSDHPLMKYGKEYPSRVELTGACASCYTLFPNVLATAAFHVINSKWFCYPGAVFPDVVSMHRASETMEHLFFTSPFLWEGRLQTLHIESKAVAWLLIVPISESELRYAIENDTDKLEDRFEEHQIDVYDLNRPPVV